MDKDQFNEHVMKLWSDVAVAVSASIGCSDKTAPAKWADAVVADFRSRFDNSNYIKSKD